MSLISVTEAAVIRGTTRQAVLKLIRGKRLRARRVGSQWVIARADLERIRFGVPGRPKSA